jgi:phosphinothricin acetyltransferase
MSSDPSFLIRPARVSDAAGIAAILNDAILHTTASWADAPRSEEETAAWLAAKATDGLPVLVACAPDADGGGILGYASYGAFRAWAGYKHTVEHSVYVAKEARRRGMGEGLLAALIERARAAGLHVMVGGIGSENEASLALHSKLGFTEVARMPEVGRKFDRWLTLVLVQRMLV